MHYTALFAHYGYLVLFVGLMLELIIFGIPTEILMGYAGVLVSQGKLNWFFAILAAGLGSCVGISVSYLIGWLLGFPFFKKYGHKIHMGPERLDQFHQWFNKYGNGLILFAYFIPGIRHITGYFSGITKLEFRKFMPFSYIGAFLYVSVYISLGKLLGPHWHVFNGKSKKFLIIGSLVLAVALIILYLYKRLKGSFLKNLKTAAQKSPIKSRLTIIGSTALFIGLFAILAKIMENYLDNNSTEFNRITTLIIDGLFNPHVVFIMKGFNLFSNHWVLIVISFATVAWMWVFKHDKLVEPIFFIIIIGIGSGLIYGLNTVMRVMDPDRLLSFLNPAFSISILVWGFFIYILVKHHQKVITLSFAIGIVLFISFLISVSQIGLGIDHPSVILTSFIFSSVWLNICIILMDIFIEFHRMRLEQTNRPI